MIDLLVLARALVESGWCQGLFAVDANGDRCDFCAIDADRFCVWGAMNRAQWELDLVGTPTHPLRGDRALVVELAFSVLMDACHNEYGRPVMQFNDHATQADALALFDAACERVGKG